MSENTEVKKRMIKKYGDRCFIEALGFRSKGDIEKELRLYGSTEQRKRAQQLTYHHIREKRNGGKATVENGALLSNMNHQWFNQQKPAHQAEMNKAFQEYKAVFDLVAIRIANKNIEKVGVVHIDEEPEDYISIPLYDNDKAYEEHKRKRNERINKKFEDFER